MATDGNERQGHSAILEKIAAKTASESWQERLSAIEYLRGLLQDLPTEHTVERIIDGLAKLAVDAKWEVRRAVVPVLVEARRPAANSLVEQLARDRNRWVRQAAERGRRKLARITSSAEKSDRQARFAFETIKSLEGETSERIYEAAIRVGERHYEELAGDTAHELNTYRTAVEGLILELKRRVGSYSGGAPEILEIVDKIEDRSRYLKTLVSSLLEYSRNVELVFQVESFHSLAAEALCLAQEKAEAYLDGAEVEVVLDVPDDIKIEASKDRLVRALVNVFSNAFESLSERTSGARLEVNAMKDPPDHLLLSVADTGTGMDPLQLESATKRFRSLKKRRGGIGLGLPLALKIIEREHQGQLAIESELGIGTTVTIRLPFKRGECNHGI
ncbi:MAG: HAMP domain-containing sensor histidine kinase [Acidobacteriota bacterium]